MNNNILEINKDINQINKTNNSEQNNNTNDESGDYEGIPILQQLGISTPNSVEYFYRTNYPEYKII